MVKKQPAPGSVANEKRAAEMPVADAAAWEEAERLYSDKSLKVADIAT